MSSRNRKPIRSSGFVQGTSIIVLVAIYFLIGAVPGKAAEQKTPEPQKVTAPQTPAAIPVAEVTMRATEVANILRRMNTLIDPSPQIVAIQKMLPEVGRNLELESSEAKRVLQDQPTLAVLQAGEQLWAHRQREMTRWLDLLTQRATQLQAALGKLADLQKTWSLTLDAAVSSKAPEPILQQIRATVAALEKVQTPLQAQPPRMLDLQSQVAQELALCESVLVEIGKAQEEAVGGFLKRETSPIWSPVLWSRGRADGPARVRRVARGLWADISQYFSDSSKGLILHIGLFVIVALLFGAARWHVRRWRVTGESSLQAIAVFERPFSAALVVTLFAATSPYLPTVPIMRKIFAILELVPMIRLTKPVVNPVVGTGLYVLGVLFALNTAREAFAGALLIEQTVIVIEALAGMAALGWVFTRGALRRFEGYGESLNRLAGLRAVAGLVLLILAICLVTGSLGYLRLSRLLLSTILAGAALALALFAYTRVALGVVAYLLRVWPLRLLRMVQHQSKLVERRIYRIFIWLAIAGWLARVLDYVGLFQPTLSLGQAILAARLERGAISISVGDVFLFFLAVWVSYLLSRFLRFVLQEDVYPRTRIGRGSSYAMSSLLHYVVLALGFVVGLGLLGVNLSKVTVLAGAFGVGIGFGLQSVVNNFVSGLILLFERPIHVGDTVEVGSLLGQVQRIGIRSSIVRTVHGAEIIVPNSQLVSEQVTNWTLSDQLRRIDLPVGVNYGADPKKVIELMEAVARAHPLVLQDPAPRGLFMGYGDSSINFELRAWTDQFSSWYQIRSDLTIAVFDAVKKEIGVSFPFPQREVRLLRDLEVAPSPKPGDSESSKSGGTNPKKLE